MPCLGGGEGSRSDGEGVAVRQPCSGRGLPRPSFLHRSRPYRSCDGVEDDDEHSAAGSMAAAHDVSEGEGGGPARSPASTRLPSDMPNWIVGCGESVRWRWSVLYKRNADRGACCTGTHAVVRDGDWAQGRGAGAA